MGLKCSSDYAQEVMENIFCDVENAEVYIDNISAFSRSWDDHMALLHAILTKNCKWAVKETDWLFYWLTLIGINP
jgi:hypothetical protein